jgi:hypothetical protein
MKRKIWIIMVLIIFLIIGCTKNDGTAVPGPSQTWIDAPLDGMTLPLAPYTIVFHGASFVGVTEFEVQINNQVVANVSPVSQGSGGPQWGTMFMGEHQWDPQAPGTYLIQVRAFGNGVFAPPDQVQVTIKGGKEVDLPDEIPQEPISGDCIYTAAVNLFCRISSGSIYAAVDNFVPDQSALVVGQSTDDYYWYVIGPNYGEICTIPKNPELGVTKGNCEGHPRFTPLPPPSPTPTRIPGPDPTPCPAGIPCPP